MNRGQKMIHGRNRRKRKRKRKIWQAIECKKNYGQRRTKQTMQQSPDNKI